MIYVPEILQARYDDNLVQKKEYRDYLQALDVRLKEEKDARVKEGMERERIDIYYEYQSLGRENDEIRVTLKLIKNQKKKRASKFADGETQFDRVLNDNTIIPL